MTGGPEDGTYAAMIDRMDRNIGRLLDKLAETGKAENTVAFFLRQWCLQ